MNLFYKKSERHQFLIIRTALLSICFLSSFIAFGSQESAKAKSSSYYALQCPTNGSSPTLFGASVNFSGSSPYVSNPSASPWTCITSNYFGATKTNTSATSGVFRGPQIRVPSETSITEIVGSLATCNAGTTHSPVFRIYNDSTSQTFYPESSGGGTRTLQNNASCSSYTTQQTGFRWGTSGTSTWSGGSVPSSTTAINASNYHTISLFLICLNSGNSCTSTATSMFSMGRNFRVLLDDNQNPTASLEKGPWENTTTRNDNNYLVRKSTGTANSIELFSTDAGGGAYKRRWLLNNGLREEAVCSPTTVSWSQAVTGASPTPSSGTLPVSLRPCPLSVTDTFSPNINNWPEGLNTISGVTYDYQNNETGTASNGLQSNVDSKSLVIDNVAPSLSQSCTGGTSGSNGWYTEAPVCTSTASDANPSALFGQVAGLDNGAGSRELLSNFATNSESGYFNRVLLTGPTYYWPLRTSSLDSESSSSSTLSSTNTTFAIDDQLPPGGGAEGARSFNGTSSILTTPSAISSLATFPVMSAWVKPTARATASPIIHLGRSDTNENIIGLYINSSGRLQMSGRLSNGNTFSCTDSTSTVLLNQWSHVAGTRSYTTGDVKLYLNGKLITTCSTASATTAQNQSTTQRELAIGATRSLAGSVTTSFSGSIAHPFFTDKALNIDFNETTASQLYFAGCSISCYSGQNVSYSPMFGSRSFFTAASDRVANRNIGAETLKIDTSNPSISDISCSGGTTGSNGWYTSSPTCNIIASDSESKPSALDVSINLNGSGYDTYSSATGYQTATRNNLAPNPRAMTTTNSWASSGMNSPTRGVVSPLLTPSSNTATFISSGGGTTGSGVYTTATISSGNRYVCSAVARRTSSSGGTFSLRWVSSDGSTVLATSSTTLSSSDGLSWTPLQVAFTPSSGTSARCGLYKEDSNTNGSINITNVLIEQQSTGGAQAFFDGAAEGSFWTGAANNSPSTMTSSLATGTATFPEGTSVLKARVTDGSGRTSETSPTSETKLDTTNPTGSWNCGTPNGSNSWFTTDISCTLTATDATSKPASATSELSQNDGTSYQTPASVSLSGTSSDSQRTGTATVSTEGEMLKLRGQVTDGAGRTTTTQPVTSTLKLDKSAATTVVNCGSPNASGWYTADITCTLTLTDAVSKPSSGKIQLSQNDGSSYDTPADCSLTGTASSSPRSCTRTISTENGTLKVQGASVNGAGLTATSTPTSTLKLDKTPPTIPTPGAAPSSPASETVTFGATTANDATSKVNTIEIQYSIDGGSNWSNISNLSGNPCSAALTTSGNDKTRPSCNFDTTLLPGAANSTGQSYLFRRQVTDTAGNTTNSSTSEVFIRNSVSLSGTFNSNVSSSATPAIGTTSDAVITQATGQTLSVTSVPTWGLKICVPDNSPKLVLSNTTGEVTEDFPSDKPLQVELTSPALGTKSLQKNCTTNSNWNAASRTGSTLTGSTLNPVSVQSRFIQNLPWSVSGGKTYSLPIQYTLSTASGLSQ